MIELLQTQTPADIPALLRERPARAAQIAHRPGGNFDTRGDAAPGAQPRRRLHPRRLPQHCPIKTFDWTTANAIMADLSKATYNYFNAERSLKQLTHLCKLACPQLNCG